MCQPLEYIGASPVSSHSLRYLSRRNSWGHGGEKKGEEEASEDFTRRDKHHFDLRDLEVMETLGD